MATSADSARELAEDGRNLSADVFISFAWGVESEAGQVRQKAVDSLEKRLRDWGYNPLMDRNQLGNGDQISKFMKRIGKGDRVLVILSEKYLRSPYCMTELHYIYQNSLGEKAEFLRRIIPVVLPDARSMTVQAVLYIGDIGKQNIKRWNWGCSFSGPKINVPIRPPSARRSACK